MVRYELTPDLAGIPSASEIEDPKIVPSPQLWFLVVGWAASFS